MSRLKTTFITVLLTLVVPLALDAARAPDWKHEDIWLKNEQGQRITPTRNSADAYSPHRTCGTCHGYMTITSGAHFQQGFDEMKDGYDSMRPWVLSPGAFGKGGAPGTFTERVAAKNNTSDRDMGLSTYDWIAAGARGQAVVLSAGNLHPGGGPLEYGRKPTAGGTSPRTSSRESERRRGRWTGTTPPDTPPTGRAISGKAASPKGIASCATSRTIASTAETLSSPDAITGGPRRQVRGSVEYREPSSPLPNPMRQWKARHPPGASGISPAVPPFDMPGTTESSSLRRASSRVVH